MSAGDRRCAGVRVRVEGVVQGVGFRPYVYRLARELGSAASCSTTSAACCSRSRATRGRGRRASSPGSPREAPPLAVVERVDCRRRRARTGERGFAIVASAAAAATPTRSSRPTRATCDDCLAELFDPGDRRFRYPFVNCTNCGPRFTIVRGVPYDRPLTTMAGFEMCAACRARVRRSRRPPLPRAAECVPRLRPARACSTRRASGAPVGSTDAVRLAARGSRAARSSRSRASAASTSPARRPTTARRARAAHAQAPRGQAVRADGARRGGGRCSWSSETAERDLLRSSRGRSCSRRGELGAPVAAPSRPASRELGVMLPYSPLHHLLLATDVGVARS